MKRVIAEITFTGEFPLDMLRYDGAYPENPEDVRKIRVSFDEKARPRGPVTVKIGTSIKECYVDRAFTVWRWKHFGCKVEVQRVAG